MRNVWLWCWVAGAVAGAGCNCASAAKFGGGDGGTDGGRGGTDSGAADAATSWNDFPPQPVFNADAGALPSNLPQLFGDAGTGGSGGPCLIEPEVGTLFPENWLRPRFTVVPAGTENVFEFRVHAPSEANDLVVYSSTPQWTMPATMWNGLSAHVVDQPITVTVRGATLNGATLTSGPDLGSTGPITIAPVGATGSIVYWTPSNGTSLEGFTIGDESTHTILTPAQAGTACVGCHASSPDGLFAGFSSSLNAGDGTQASVNFLSVDGGASPLPFLSSSAAALLGRTEQQLPKTSAAHWVPGDRVTITMFGGGIIWTDLEATSQTEGVGWGVLQRGGDSQQASYASFDHTGQRVLYVSASSAGAGVIAPDGIVRIIPWNARDGGTSTTLPGADDATYNNFYPVFSSDDQLVAFNRVPTGQTSYNDPLAELYVVSGAGGTATRLAANDPPACLGVTSPGITNSWPRWSPAASTVNGKTYYWLTFSSNSSSSQRLAGNTSPQLYMTAVVADANGITTYPALYMWNQPASQHNHTPAWDVFQIPFQ